MLPKAVAALVKPGLNKPGGETPGPEPDSRLAPGFAPLSLTPSSQLDCGAPEAERASSRVSTPEIPSCDAGRRKKPLSGIKGIFKNPFPHYLPINMSVSPGYLFLVENIPISKVVLA